MSKVYLIVKDTYECEKWVVSVWSTKDNAENELERILKLQGELVNKHLWEIKEFDLNN